MKKQVLKLCSAVIMTACLSTPSVLVSASAIIGIGENTSAKTVKEEQNYYLNNKTQLCSDDELSKIFKDVNDYILTRCGYEHELKNYEVTFTKDFIDGSNYMIDVDIVADMTMVVNPENHPYIKGMENAKEQLTLEQDKEIASQIIDVYKTDLYQIYNVNERTEFNYRVSIPCDETGIPDFTQQYKLYFRMDITNDESILSLVNMYSRNIENTPIHLMMAGSDYLKEEIEKATEVNTYANVTYSGDNAVQYARSHAADEPEYNESNGGSDCANFVSKSLNYGGIPTEGNATTGWIHGGDNWIRTGYYGNGGVIPYMKQKGYFKTVTSPGTTNKGIVKGSIMYWNNKSHVALVAYVSSTTVKYFQHSSKVQSADAKFYDSKNDDITFYSPTATIS